MEPNARTDITTTCVRYAIEVKWRIIVATQGSKPVHEFPREALNRLNAHRLLTLFNRWYKHAQCGDYLQYP